MFFLMGLWNRVCGLGGLSAPSWQTLSHLGVRGVWKDGNCWQHLCVYVCVCVHRGATFDKHEEITMRCCQRVLSLAGGWKRARSVIFSDEQRTRDDASYRFAQTHMLKHDMCMPAHTHTHTFTHQGPDIESVHLPVMAPSPVGQEV